MIMIMISDELKNRKKINVKKLETDNYGMEDIGRTKLHTQPNDPISRAGSVFPVSI